MSLTPRIIAALSAALAEGDEDKYFHARHLLKQAHAEVRLLDVLARHVEVELAKAQQIEQETRH